MRYFRIFLLHFQDVFAQRSLSFVWFLMAFIAPLLMLLFWRGVKGLPGWTIQELTTYYFVIIILGSFIMTHIEERIAKIDIQEGQLTMFLLKPFPYIWLKCFYTLPNRLIQGTLGLLFFLLLIIINPSLFTFTHSPLIVLLSLLVIICGFVLAFIFKMIVGLVAFWTTEARGIIEITSAIIVVFGGYVMPISLFPDWLMQFSSALPFAYMVYFPVLTIIGKLTVIEVLQGLLVQLLWSSILFLCYKKLWNAGIRKYSAVGQ